MPVRRSLTWGLVAAVAASGLAGVEAWPLTGWRLFSGRRGPVTTRYEARVVALDGSEAAVPFNLLPHSYSGSGAVLVEMAGQRPEQREPACLAWASATARLTGKPVAEVRVYRLDDDLRRQSTQATPKLLRSGPAWVLSDNLRWSLAAGRGGSHQADLSRWLVAHPPVCVALAAGIVALELSGPLVWLRPRLAVPFVAASAVMHTGTWLLLGLDYWAHLATVALVLLPWARMRRR